MDRQRGVGTSGGCWPPGRGLQAAGDPAGRPSHGAVHRGDVELDPPRTWANRGYGGLPVTVLANGRVEPLADGKRSRLTISTQFQGHGIGKLLVPLLARRLTRQLPRDEQKLRQLLEQGTQAQT